MSVQETVVEWFTCKDTSYLFGAGCSACANKPLVAELTLKVLAEQTEKLKELFSSLTAEAGRNPHIEDLMNFLLRLRYLSQSSSIPILTD